MPNSDGDWFQRGILVVCISPWSLVMDRHVAPAGVSVLGLMKRQQQVMGYVTEKIVTTSI
jgi:hypothetical protein